MTFKAFENNDEVLTLKSGAGEFSIENDTERVVVSGELDIPRDKTGLKLVRDALAAFQAIEKALAEDKNLPDVLEIPPNPTTTVANPF